MRLITALIAAFSIMPAHLGAQEPAGLRDALRLLDVWVGTTVAQRGQPGLSIGVVYDDQLLWAKGYGYSDIEKKTLATPQTLYHVGSITKTFTAVSILQLRDAGKLKLDDSLRQHVSRARIRAHTPDAADITIRELLTHTSGIEREVPGTSWSDPSFPSTESLNSEVEQPYRSSTEWKYSNLGFALLGEVVAAVSGEPWERYVQAHVLDPLGMSRTRPVPALDQSGMATGYARPKFGEPHVAVRRTDFGAVNAAGSMASTVEDLGRYLAFHIAEEEPVRSPVLRGRTLREMHRPQWLLDDWQNAWGLGMRVRRVDSRVRVGHGGSVPGYTAFIEFIPSLRIGVVVLTNADDGNPASYGDYALQLLTPIVAKAAARQTRSLPADAARYTGRYRSQNANTTSIVAILDGQLSLVSPDAPNPYTARTILEPTAEPHMFVMRSTGAYSSGAFGERLTFEVGSDGRVTGYRTPATRYTRVGELP